MPVGTTHSASEQGRRLKRSCLPQCTLPARLQCECVSASKGAGSAETLSRHHSVLVHVAATRGILRSCSRGGLHSGPVCNSHSSQDQVPTALRVPACACRYARRLVNCRTSVEIALHTISRTRPCDLQLTSRTLTERPLAKPLVAECPRGPRRVPFGGARGRTRLRVKGVWEGTSSTPCAHLGATTLRKALAGLACRTNGLAHKC